MLRGRVQVELSERVPAPAHPAHRSPQPYTTPSALHPRPEVLQLLTLEVGIGTTHQGKDWGEADDV